MAMRPVPVEVLQPAEWGSFWMFTGFIYNNLAFQLVIEQCADEVSSYHYLLKPEDLLDF